MSLGATQRDPNIIGYTATNTRSFRLPLFAHIYNFSPQRRPSPCTVVEWVLEMVVVGRLAMRSKPAPAIVYEFLLVANARRLFGGTAMSDGVPSTAIVVGRAPETECWRMSRIWE